MTAQDAALSRRQAQARAAVLALGLLVPALTRALRPPLLRPSRVPTLKAFEGLGDPLLSKELGVWGEFEILTSPTPHRPHWPLLSKHHFKILVLIFLKPPLLPLRFFLSFLNLTLVSNPSRPQQNSLRKTI